MKHETSDTTKTPLGQPLATRAEVANHFSVHTETVKRWTRSGRLPAIKLSSRAVRYRWSDVRQLLSEAGA